MARGPPRRGLWSRAVGAADMRWAAGGMRRKRSPNIAATIRKRISDASRRVLEAEAGPLWASISEKRKGRNAKRAETPAYDRLTCADPFPPRSIAGQRRPIDPSAGAPGGCRPTAKSLPVVADWLEGRLAEELLQFTSAAPDEGSRVQARPMPVPRGTGYDRGSRAVRSIRARTAPPVFRHRQSTDGNRESARAAGARFPPRWGYKPVAHHKQGSKLVRTGPRNW